MRRLFIGLLVLFAFPALTGCTLEVPAGHVGRTWEPSGFAPDIVKPGRVKWDPKSAILNAKLNKRIADVEREATVTIKKDKK